MDTPQLQPQASEAGRMIVELPLQVEAVAEVGGERLDTQGFGGVVTRVDHVETPLHRVEVGVVRSPRR